MEKHLNWIYVCSPCRGNYELNIRLAELYCREVAALGYLPVAPHIYFTRFLDDRVTAERNQGLKMGLELLKQCSQVWVYGEVISEGMAAEIELARQLGIPVVKRAAAQEPA